MLVWIKAFLFEIILTTIIIENGFLIKHESVGSWRGRKYEKSDETKRQRKGRNDQIKLFGFKLA